MSKEFEDIKRKIDPLNYSSSLKDFTEIFTLDIKKLLDLGKYNNAVDAMMRFYNSNSGGLEYHEIAKEIYNKLVWDSNCFDVINSFWTIYTCALAVYDVSTNKPLYKFKNDSDGIIKVVMDKNSAKDKDADYVNIKKEYYVREYIDFKDGIKQYAGNRSAEKTKMYDMVQNKELLQSLAKTCHSPTNFMPCPDNKFNSAKGYVVDVKDFLTLMIDKIQQCIDRNAVLSYINDGKAEEIDIDTLKKWQDWFINNRKLYLLENYYYVTFENGQRKIKGVHFFEKQSLQHPLPLDQEELKECINEVLKRNMNRMAEMILRITR